jgi:large subunit ribosomal protein L22
MTIKAHQTFTRTAPRKARLVANAVRKLPLDQAMQQLAVIEKRATVLVSKVLRQAIANATHNHGLSANDLAIKSILINEGPRYKRYQPVGRGRANSILKRTCHVTVELMQKTAAVVSKTAKPVSAEKSSAKSAVAPTVQPTARATKKAKES